MAFASRIAVRSAAGVARTASRSSAASATARRAASSVTNKGPTDHAEECFKLLEEKGVSAAAHVSQASPADGTAHKCPFLSKNEYLLRSAQRESNARGYVRKFPMCIEKAEGIILTDTDGKQYYDCLGVAGTLALGHNHPVINDAIKKYMDSKAPMQFLDLATTWKDEFMTKLFNVLPKELSRMHFPSPAGTDCLDAAVKLCKIATGRKSVISFHGGYHGHGQAPLAMMGNLGAKSKVQGLMSDVNFLPYPYSFRNPFGIEGEEGEAAVMRYIETALTEDESGIVKPACVVVEAIQGEGGVQPMSKKCLQELRRITKEQDIPLVIDEVQSGFCRSGDFFSFQHGDIVPDVVCMSKAVGGTMPMAAIAFREELNEWAPGAHTGTFRGNGLAFAAGSASLDFMTENKMWDKVAKKGERMTKFMQNLREETNCIGDIRGRGLIQGIELVDFSTRDHLGDPVPHSALASKTQEECFRRGLILEKGGRGGAVMRMLPPLIIEEDDLDTCMGLFAESLKAACEKVGVAPK